jgi:hypothetical protein
LSKILSGVVAVAMVSMLLFTAMAVPAEANTDGRAFKHIAKGTIYNSTGGVVQSDVWFVIDIFSGSYTMNLGSNVKASNINDLSIYSGTLDNLDGPLFTLWSWSFSTMTITAMYTYGESVSSYTITPNTAVVVLKPGFGTGLGSVGSSPTPKMTGPNVSDMGWAGLAAAVVIALLLICSLILVDRKR